MYHLSFQNYCIPNIAHPIIILRNPAIRLSTTDTFTGMVMPTDTQSTQ